MQIKNVSLLFSLAIVLGGCVPRSVSLVDLSKPEPTVPEEPVEEYNPVTVSDDEEIVAGLAAGQEQLVVRVIDGDTIELESGERVRYIGIDTPETVHPSQAVQCFGKEASAYNRVLVEGKTVRLEKDLTDRDKYHRLLRYVYVGELFVNLELVKQGYASSYTYPPDVEHQDELVAAERAARAAKRGLWSACNEESNSLISDQVSCPIKGNISFSTGEKIYHLPGCDYYNQTVISASQGERWFCSEAEAIAAGWRQAQNCP